MSSNKTAICSNCLKTIKMGETICGHCGYVIQNNQESANSVNDKDWFERTFDSPGLGKTIVFGCLSVPVMAIIFSGIGINSCMKKREAERIVQERIDAQEAKEAAAERKRDREKGFHCLSSIDGSHPDVVEMTKRLLRDPSSFSHASTYITRVDDSGEHRLTMNYRAANGFGGMSIGSVTAIVDHETCDAKLDYSSFNN